MKLALFFSHGISLKNWEDIGHLDRELKFYRHLRDFLEEVYFFTYGGREDASLQPDAVGKIKILYKKWKIPSILYGMLLPLVYHRYLKTVDILKTNQMSASVAAVSAKIILRKKFLVRCGYEWLNVLEKEKKARWKQWTVYLLEKIAYGLADKIVFTSQKDLDFAQHKFKISSAKIELIPNYIDTDLFKPDGTVKERNSIIFVGRLSREKNIDNLIKAVAGLPAKLKIIGKGDLKEQLVQLVKDTGADVEFVDRIPNDRLPGELNKAEIFVLPSFYEGCPKALLEAMSCGLTCVGTNVEGIKEIIQDGQNGLLTDLDANSIKATLRELLHNPDLKERLAGSGRQTILDRFSLPTILAKEVALYQELCQ